MQELPLYCSAAGEICQPHQNKIKTNVKITNTEPYAVMISWTTPPLLIFQSNYIAQKVQVSFMAVVRHEVITLGSYARWPHLHRDAHNCCVSGCTVARVPLSLRFSKWLSASHVNWWGASLRKSCGGFCWDQTQTQFNKQYILIPIISNTWTKKKLFFPLFVTLHHFTSMVFANFKLVYLSPENLTW